MNDEHDLFAEMEDVETNTGDVPEVGMFPGVPFETYARWKAINSGIVKWGGVSMKHMLAAFEGRLKSEDTRDRKLGRAIHHRILEPLTFAEQFRIAGPCEATIKSGDNKGKPCGAAASWEGPSGGWFCGIKGHRPDGSTRATDTVSVGEFDRCDSIAAALHGHFAIPLLRRTGWSEMSMVWKWRDWLLKGRADRISTGGGRPMILDVKKCQVGKGRREDCQRAIENYGYHRQAAMYCKGAEALTGIEHEFVWIFVEDNEPFDIQVIPATKDDLEIGWEQVARVLDTFDRQYKANDCFGYLWKPINIKPGGLSQRYINNFRQAGG